MEINQLFKSRLGRKVRKLTSLMTVNPDIDQTKIISLNQHAKFQSKAFQKPAYSKFLMIYGSSECHKALMNALYQHTEEIYQKLGISNTALKGLKLYVESIDEIN